MVLLHSRLHEYGLVWVSFSNIQDLGSDGGCELATPLQSQNNALLGVAMSQLRTRGARSHIFRLRLRSYSKFSHPYPAPKFFEFQNPTLVQTAKTISATKKRIYCVVFFSFLFWPCRFLLLPKIKSDSAFRSGLSKIFDSGFISGFERKRRILPEMNPSLWIIGYLLLTLLLTNRNLNINTEKPRQRWCFVPKDKANTFFYAKFVGKNLH